MGRRGRTAKDADEGRATGDQDGPDTELHGEAVAEDEAREEGVPQERDGA